MDKRDPETIYNWVRLDDRISTSGQPDEAHLAGLAANGVRHIVNLGLHSHERALPDEAASVAALGMAYHHRPVDFANPTEDDFAWFVQTVEALKGEAVHIHCIANYRVSAFFYRYQRDHLGMDEAAARAAMDALWTPEGVWEDFIA
jgi:protein tyrosine phosphatase (PTP) superfamily phosphohydrolase (DUF442 family)